LAASIAYCLAFSDCLNALILNTFSLAVLYCLLPLQFPIPLTPSALIPSAWQLLLTIAFAVPYSLNAFSLNSFILAVP
jgi:hypothetical protein